MPSVSHSSWLACPMPIATAHARTDTAATSRCSGVSIFESRTPRRCSGAGMTAATVTGPAHAPRPTSSIPQTSRSPAFQHFRSRRSVGRGARAVTRAHASNTRPPRGAHLIGSLFVPAPALLSVIGSRGGMRRCPRVYDRRVDPGTRVEVRSRFDQAWARGFEVAEQVARRPGSPLPRPPPLGRLRAARAVRRPRSARRATQERHVVDLAGPDSAQDARLTRAPRAALRADLRSAAPAAWSSASCPGPPA